MTDLQNLLRQTAEVYRNLVQHAKAASVPVPPEAQLGTGIKRGPDELEYDEFAAANATDWDDFQDEGTLHSTRMSLPASSCASACAAAGATGADLVTTVYAKAQA